MAKNTLALVAFRGYMSTSPSREWLIKLQDRRRP
jgi:hypothetical protein